MRLSLILSKLRSELIDADSDDWTDAELSGIISDQQLIMVRKQVAIDEKYHNHKFDLLTTDATQISGDVWSYRLPPWVMRITEVRLMQTSNIDPRKNLIPEIHDGLGKGFQYSKGNRIELWQWGDAQDITISCAKRPARLTKGTLPDQTAMTASEMRLDEDSASGDASNHPHESVDGSYVNGMFEITGVDSGATPRYVSGQMRRCTNSQHGQQLSTTLHTLLTFEDAWSPILATADTYEMHPEIADEHMRCLILLSARAAWQRKGNFDEIRASSPEFTQEWNEFMSHIRPRSLTGPRVIKSRVTPQVFGQHGDDNPDFYWNGQGSL